MEQVPLTQAQMDCAKSSQKFIFLEGDSGTGKTTTAIFRMIHLISSGVPAHKILILTPQRTLASPYFRAIQSPGFPSGSIPTILTLGGLARRMIDLFWPLIAAPAGFRPTISPTHLTMETAQYFLSILLEKKFQEGFFETLHMDRNRLYGQILDNLNKAAVIGFPYQQFGEKLAKAWVGRPEQIKIYEQAQECAILFRNYCLEHNYLDYSLQIEVFTKFIWRSLLFKKYFDQQYTHLIFDNLEEDVPIVHDLISEWMPRLQTGFFIFDSDGGYRSFLGADSQSAYSIKDDCDVVFSFKDSFIESSNMKSFRHAINSAIFHQKPNPAPSMQEPVFTTQTHLFITDMIIWTADTISALVYEKKVTPGEICILSPFLSDSFRFAMTSQLEKYHIPVYSRRPSRSLREEKSNLCLLTLASLAHPQWGYLPTKQDVRSMLMQSIEGIDLIRADLLTRICYRPQKEECLSSFEEIQPEIQNRITYSIGERFERLRAWLFGYWQSPMLDLDIFLSKLYGEILSQPGFGFHSNLDATASAARLIESVQKFRYATSEMLQELNLSMGSEYIRLVHEGLLAAQYVDYWEPRPKEAVFLAPAYTFLMFNESIQYQFWMDISSLGWWERLNQPLTQPYILNRHWEDGRQWTHADEEQACQVSMSRLISGLIRRCSKHIFLCASGMNEQGNEERGPLLQAVQSVLRAMKNSN